jgi:hypothetical protein
MDAQLRVVNFVLRRLSQINDDRFDRSKMLQYCTSNSSYAKDPNANKCVLIMLKDVQSLSSSTLARLADLPSGSWIP